MARRRAGYFGSLPNCQVIGKFPSSFPAIPSPELTGKYCPIKYIRFPEYQLENAKNGFLLLLSHKFLAKIRDFRKRSPAWQAAIP